MDSLNPIKSLPSGNRDGHYLPQEASFASYQENPNDDIDVREIFKSLKRRLVPAMQVTALSFVAFMAWSFIRPPLYQRQFSMAVEPLDKFVSDSSGSPFAALPGGVLPGLGLPGGVGGGTDYSSLITVLQSELVLAPVVQVGQSIDPEFDYETLVDQLTIQQIETSKILEVSFDDTDPDLVQKITAKLQETFLEYSTETQQMAMIRRLNDLDAQIEVQRQTVASAQASLLQFQGDNQILDLKIAGEAIEMRRSEVLLEQQNTRLALNATLQKYNTLQKQLGLGPEEAFAVANLSEAPIYQKLLTEYRDLESQIAIQLARFREDTPIIQALRDRQNQLRPLLQAEAERNVGNSLGAPGTVNPQSLGYQGTVGRGLVAELVASVNQIQMLDAKDKSLSQLYGALSDQLDNLVNLGGNYREIERNLALSEAALQGLLAAQQQLKLDLERDTNPWLIVSGYDLTTPLEPESSLLLNIVLGLVASSILGLGTALILEFLDRSYRDPEQIHEKTGLPVLASIPHWLEHLKALNHLASPPKMGFSTALVPAKEQSAPLADSRQHRFESAFRELSTNLRLLSSTDTPIQIVAVASSLAEEGKTTVAAHLATATASMGRKVLLIGCDVDCPQLSQWLQVKIRHQSSMPLDSVRSLGFDVQSVSDIENLDLLQFPIHGSHTLSQSFDDAEFGQILKSLRSAYDLILLDTKSVLSGADAKLVSQYADATLLVVKVGKTTQEAVNETVKDFRSTSRTPILGIVANGAELR